MKILEFEFDGHVLGVRDIEIDDVPHFVAYWHDGGADLEFLGIDREKLGSRSDTTERFMSYRRKVGNPEAVGFTLTCDDSVIGYTNFNMRGRRPGYGFAHAHLTDETARRCGYLSQILSRSLEVLYTHVVVPYDLDGVVFETRTRNVGINRVVSGAGHTPDSTEYLSSPDGVAGPGEFNVVTLERDDLSNLVSTEVAGA